MPWAHTESEVQLCDFEHVWAPDCWLPQLQTGTVMQAGDWGRQKALRLSCTQSCLTGIAIIAVFTVPSPRDVAQRFGVLHACPCTFIVPAHIVCDCSWSTEFEATLMPKHTSAAVNRKQMPSAKFQLCLQNNSQERWKKNWQSMEITSSQLKDKSKNNVTTRRKTGH